VKRAARLVGIAVLAAACGPEPETPRDPAPGVGTPPEARSDTVAPDTSWTAGIVDRVPSGVGIATLRSVRAARHEAFDRVVWELSGPAPGVHVEYVDRPVRQCGSGDPVPLPGDAWLEVRLEPAVAHTEEGRPTMDERRAEPGLPVVIEIVQTCDFEAVVTWAVAVRAPERFRVTALEDPTRVVVDLRHGTR
jgi:hypothetical protein